MSRITRIELCDYRAFPGPAVTQLQLNGDKRHLLLYGENGSGKTSLARALPEFFDARSTPPALAFTACRHVFTDSAFQGGHVTLSFDDEAIPPLAWTLQSGRTTAHPLFPILCASLAWLDYDRIRRIYSIDRLSLLHDIFPLCMGILLADVPMPARGDRFGVEWKELNAQLGRPRGRGRAARSALDRIEERLKRFNQGLAAFLVEWQKAANELLQEFVGQTEIKLLPKRVGKLARITGGGWRIIAPEIEFTLGVRGHTPANPVTFLNEARLTACALSLWLAALQRSRPAALGEGHSYPRVLVLDDVLLSLDMDHRRPLLSILEKHFADWQVLLLTHNRAWYEVAKQRLPEKNWQYTELFAVRVGDYETPIVQEDEEHLYRALRYLEPAPGTAEPVDVKAAAAHVRTKFELLLKQFNEDLRVPVQFYREAKLLAANTLWGALKGHRTRLRPPQRIFFDGKGRPHAKQPAPVEVPVVPPALVWRIDHALSWVMNPLVHSETVERYRDEIFDAIFALDELESVLTEATKGRAPNPHAGKDRLLQLLEARRDGRL